MKAFDCEIVKFDEARLILLNISTGNAEFGRGLVRGGAVGQKASQWRAN